LALEELAAVRTLGGFGKVVEIDESLLHKRKYHRGREKPEIWVFGFCQRKEVGWHSIVVRRW
jgi:hypothetical protein